MRSNRNSVRTTVSRLVALGACLGFIVTLTAGPAAAASLPTMGERETWTNEEHREYGQDLFEDVDPAAPVEARQGGSSKVPAAPDGVVTTEGGVAGSGDLTPLSDVIVDEAVLDVPSTGSAKARVGGVSESAAGLTVTASRRSGATHQSSKDESLRVRTLGHDAAQAAGVSGVLLAVSATEPGGPNDPADTVDLGIDVSRIAGPAADWASRAQLVQLPACALTTPDKTECRTQTPLASGEDDSAYGVATGAVDIPAASASRSAAGADAAVIAVTAAASGSDGDWAASPLAASAAWNVSAQTGSFSWSYPMRTPPSPGGLDPDISLGYDSGSLDGKVASANSQAGEIGDGWSLSTGGFIERSYVPCAQDTAGDANNATHKTGDLCWKSDNATLVLGGKSTDLVKDAGGIWRPEDDDNTKVERFTGTSTGTPGWNLDDDKEWWKVTTADGTRYYFGRGKTAGDGLVTDSAFHVRVYGNHPGEPCHEATFGASGCDQAWRWNLEYVVDTSRNSMTYQYTPEENSYGYNDGQGVADYTAGGSLTRILYGTREGAETADSPARVVFTKVERCLATSEFDCAVGKLKDNPNKWPDVPADLVCAVTATDCPGLTSPSFFTRKRVTAVNTQIYTGSAYKGVDRWLLSQTFPDPGGSTGHQLWLESVEHLGLAATAAADDVTLPKVTFTGRSLPNRVDATGDQGLPMYRFRIIQIQSESGGLTSVTYSDKDCTTTSLPGSPQSNTRRCFPVHWTPAGADTPIPEYFHKYVVTDTYEHGRVTGSVNTQTHYNYIGDPAWHYDDDEMTRPKQRTWGQWRGYGTVDVKVGEADVVEEPQLITRYRYFRGMHGDRDLNADGTPTTRSVQVDGINDVEQFSGMVREEISYNGPGTVVERTLSTPWRSAETASSGGKTAHHTGVSQTETRVTAPALASGLQTSRVSTEFDAYGMPERVHDAGDTTTGADDRCVVTYYVRNTDDNILDTVRRKETLSTTCSATPSRPDDVVSDQRFAYDGLAVGGVPTKGLVTATQEAKTHSGTTPQYIAIERTTYDAFGRVLTASDALDRVTTTAYAQTSGLTTRVTETSPDPDGTENPLASHRTITDVDPAFGVPTGVTDPDGNTVTGKYDGLGRLVGVWQPDRVQGTDTATTTFAYTVANSGMNAVTTSTLNHDATSRVTSSVLYDGLMRQRQTQSPSADKGSPGRVVTDMIYDSRGLNYLTNDPWFTTGAPGTTVVTPANNASVRSSTLTRFDGAGRPTDQIHRAAADERWRTTTTYRGDRVLVDPPQGATPTTTITDARGNTTVLRQFTGASTSGDYRSTTYTYDHADRLEGARDDAGNEWAYEYDLRGRQTEVNDPDKGTTTTTYDDAGQVLSTIDGRGEVLAYTYDALGRKTSMRDDTSGGALRASWTYDTLAVGMPTSQIRYDGDAQYVTAATGYDDLGRPLGTNVTIPNTPATTALARTYTTTYSYTEDGRLLQMGLPAAGALGAETVGTYYDSANQAEWMAADLPSVWGTYVFESTYSPYGELLQAGLGTGWMTDVRWDYEDDTRRLAQTRVQHEGRSGYDLDATYSYDDAGNVLGIANTPTVSGVQADKQCFNYDGLQRLTDAWTPSSGDCAAAPTAGGLGGADPYWTTYTHDVTGNRKTAVQHATTANGGDKTSTYTYPAAGAAKAHAVSQVVTTNAAGANTGTSSFAYDQVGNMTGREIAGQATQSLAWDAEGELDNVSQDGNGDGDTADTGEKDEYIYTADGERLLRVQDGKATVYLPGGQEVTAPVTGQTGSVTATRYYSFNGQTIAARTAGGAAGTTTIIPDHHGTGTLQIVQATNAITRKYTDPYGGTRGAVLGDADADGRLDGTNPTWTGDHGFLDKPLDTTGLTAIGARMYDAVLGRFISVDPVMDLSDPQQWNAYSYANNNPATLSDPTGKNPYTHDGSSGPPSKPPVQEALPKDKKTKSGGGVAAQAPTAGEPGTYVPPPPTSTSSGGGYYSASNGGGESSGGNSGTTRKPFENKPLNLTRDDAFLMQGPTIQKPNPLDSLTGDEVPPGMPNTDYEAMGNMLGWVSFGAGILALVTGPAAPVFGLISVVTGWGGALAGCAGNGWSTVSCGLGLFGATLGMAGFGVRALQGILGAATVSDDTIRGADEVATGVGSLWHLDGQFGEWADSRVGLPGW